MGDDMVGTRQFRAIRADAYEALNRGTRDPDGYEILCVWQDRHDEHVGIYCNALSHLEPLGDLLEHGAWCDEVAVPAEFVGDECGVEELFRFYSMAFLMLSECLADLRDIARTVRRQAKMTEDAEHLIAYINRVWKHRESTQGEQPPFHKAHHHGPYLFADAVDYQSALPPDGRYIALDHAPTGSDVALPLVVPSLVDAVRSVGAQVEAINTILEDPHARAEVEGAWAVPAGHSAPN